MLPPLVEIGWLSLVAPEVLEYSRRDPTLKARCWRFWRPKRAEKPVLSFSVHVLDWVATSGTRLTTVVEAVMEKCA
jgi:hypothetical protein